MIILLLVAALIVFMGWGVEKKKWYFLISGYNMMSDEEKKNVDVENLAKSIAKMCYVLAALLVVMAVSIKFEIWFLVWIATGLIIIVPLFSVFRMQKYDYNSSVFGSKKSKKITSIITLITVLIVGIIVYTSIQPTKYDVTDESFNISGMYGKEMKWEDITNVELLDNTPEVTLRVNGSSIGSVQKGNFKLKSGENAKLFIDQKIKKSIFIEYLGEKFYLNDKTEHKTTDLYNEIIDKWKQ